VPAKCSQNLSPIHLWQVEIHQNYIGAWYTAPRPHAGNQCQGLGSVPDDLQLVLDLMLLQRFFYQSISPELSSARRIRSFMSAPSA